MDRKGITSQQNVKHGKAENEKIFHFSVDFLKSLYIFDLSNGKQKIKVMKTTKEKTSYQSEAIEKMVFHMMQICPNPDRLKFAGIEGQKIILNYQDRTRIEITF